MQQQVEPLAVPLGIRVKRRWIALRNRVIASPRFQANAARNPLLRPVARRRSAALFDLVSGFIYTQTLLAALEGGVIDLLAGGMASTRDVAQNAGLGDDAALRLLRAAEAIGLVEHAGGDCWMLGEQGAVLHANAGARAMIRHHPLLYDDLAKPLELLRSGRREETRLSRFWAYAAHSVDAAEYSQLMAASQEMVCEQVLASGVLPKNGSLLDVGGGLGVFASKVVEHRPALRMGVFDLPEVIVQTRTRLAGKPVELHPGNFFRDPLPGGYDCLSLVRILHDHDDDKALLLLRAARQALGQGGRLIIAEPMAGVRGAERMGDAYFGFYLWAMGSGRPRRRGELGAMLLDAGFANWRPVATNLPVITSLIVAST